MEIGSRKAIYPIGIVAEILGIHPRTLRIYEQEGLIKPARRGGKRFYSNTDLDWLRCLRKLLTEEGFNIAGIKKLLVVAPGYIKDLCQEERAKEASAQ